MSSNNSTGCISPFACIQITLEELLSSICGIRRSRRRRAATRGSHPLNNEGPRPGDIHAPLRPGAIPLSLRSPQIRISNTESDSLPSTLTEATQKTDPPSPTSERSGARSLKSAPSTTRRKNTDGASVDIPTPNSAEDLMLVSNKHLNARAREMYDKCDTLEKQCETLQEEALRVFRIASLRFQEPESKSRSSKDPLPRPPTSAGPVEMIWNTISSVLTSTPKAKSKRIMLKRENTKLDDEDDSSSRNGDTNIYRRPRAPTLPNASPNAGVESPGSHTIANNNEGRNPRGARDLKRSASQGTGAFKTTRDRPDYRVDSTDRTPSRGRSDHQGTSASLLPRSLKREQSAPPLNCSSCSGSRSPELSNFRAIEEFEDKIKYFIRAIARKSESCALSFESFSRVLATLTRQAKIAIGSNAPRCMFINPMKQMSPWEDGYENVGKLGEGSFGRVYAVTKEDTTPKHHRRWKSGNGNEGRQAQRVLKEIPKVEQAQRPENEVVLEISTLMALDHPHVIRLFEAYEDEKNLYLILDQAQGGTLEEAIESTFRQGLKLPNRFKLLCMSHVLQAVTYCHTRSIVHMDLKAANVMMMNKWIPGDEAKADPFFIVIDFGLAQVLSPWYDNKIATLSGTPLSMAPEVWRHFQRSNFSVEVGPPADIWSCGCIAYQLFAGKEPYMVASSKPAKWLQLISAGYSTTPLRGHDDAKDLISKMLTYKADDRITGAEAVNHRWFRGLKSPSCGPSIKKMDSKTFLSRLECYQNHSSVLKALILQVASQISPNEFPHITAIFEEFDTDKSGILERKEFMAAIRKFTHVDEEAAEKLVSHLDISDDGNIHYTEFLAAMLRKGELQDEGRLWNAFKAYDADGSGTVNQSELDIMEERGILEAIEGARGGKLEKQCSIPEGGISYDYVRNYFHSASSSSMSFRKSSESLDTVNSTFNGFLKKASKRDKNDNKQAPSEFGLDKGRRGLSTSLLEPTKEIDECKVEERSTPSKATDKYRFGTPSVKKAGTHNSLIPDPLQERMYQYLRSTVSAESELKKQEEIFARAHTDADEARGSRKKKSSSRSQEPESAPVERRSRRKEEKMMASTTAEVHTTDNCGNPYRLTGLEERKRYSHREEETMGTAVDTMDAQNVYEQRISKNVLTRSLPIGYRRVSKN